jgi:hypothetical protein
VGLVFVDGDVLESFRQLGGEPGEGKESVMPMDCRRLRRME